MKSILLALGTATTLTAGAQTDITVVALNADTIEVRLLPHDDFDQLMSSLVFTLRWDTGDVHIGAPDQFSYGGPPFCQFSTMAVNGNGEGELDINGYRYATFGNFANLVALGANCAWTANVEVPLVRFPITFTNSCADFQIVNDAYTGPNNKDYFISLNAVDSTGVIYGSGAQNMGSCSIGLAENTGPAVVLGPVPSSDVLNISTTNLQIRTWSVIDTEGRVVRIGGPTAGDRLSIDVRPLPPGAYALRLVTDQGVRTERFAVAR